jgi:hypothetical protein
MARRVAFLALQEPLWNLGKNMNAIMNEVIMDLQNRKREDRNAA